MKKALKRITLCLICLITVPALSGCWGYTDIGEVFIVMGAAIDMDFNTNQYVMEIEILRPLGGQETQMKVQEVTGKGVTVFDAIRDAIIDAGGRLYWGHTQVWVISQEVAENGILPVLDFVSRGVEFRSDIAILIMQKNSIARLIGQHTERELHDGISQHLNEMLAEYQRSGIYVKPPVWKVLSILEDEQESLTLPLLEVYQKQGKEVLGLWGSAVFKGDRMIGELSFDESKYLYLLNGKITEEYILSIPEMQSLPRMTIEIEDTEIDTKISVEGNKLKASAKCKIIANLSELESTKDYLVQKGIKYIERAFGDYIREQMMDVVETAQKKYGTDILGFGHQVHIQAPDYWQGVKQDWNTAFRDMDIQVEVSVEITRTGLNLKPLAAAGGE